MISTVKVEATACPPEVEIQPAALQVAGRRLLSMPDLCGLYGGSERPLNPSTVYRWIAQGLFPRPIKLGGGTSRWIESECEATVERAIIQRDKSAA